jgi:hypothetical protein
VAETVSKDDLVKRDLECRDLVDEAKDYLLLPPEKRQLMNGKRMQRRMVAHTGILFACDLSVSILLTISVRLSVHCLVGGQSNYGAESSVERMDAGTGEWRLVAPMLTKRQAPGVAVLNDQLFVVGGRNGSNFLSSMEWYCFCPDCVLGNTALAVNIKISVTIRTETNGTQHDRCPLLADIWARLNPMDLSMQLAVIAMVAI